MKSGNHFVLSTEKVAAGDTHVYLYDAQGIIEERISGTSSDTLRYFHGAGIDEPLARTNSSSAVTYYLADHLGSIVQETSASSSVTLEREYDAWGKQSLGATASGYSYTGREWDSETSLYYYRLRYYSPYEVRFLTEDSAGFADGPNKLSYVLNSPLNYIDPFGLEHTLTFDGKVVTLLDDNGHLLATFPATSGRPGHEDTREEWHGPIPEGEYTLDPNEVSEGGFIRSLTGDWGSHRAPLHPNASTKTFGRDNFFLHGGSKPGSGGCIDLGGRSKHLLPYLKKHNGPITVKVNYPPGGPPRIQ